jgi:putative membrane protein
MRIGYFLFAVALFASAWLGPLPDLARESFTAHMTLHIAVIAVAAPLLALAVAGTMADPVKAFPHIITPVPASMFELVVVWVWHVPVLHHAARHAPGAFFAEQATFVVAGVLLWVAVLGGDREQRRIRAGAGVAALLLTSMHMTLLGALFALANRPLFLHATSAPPEEALADQHLGGVIMLLVGGASYLIGGLGLTVSALRAKTESRLDRQESTV